MNLVIVFRFVTHQPSIIDFRSVWKWCRCQGRRCTARNPSCRRICKHSDFQSSQDDSADNGSYSEPVSESEVEEDTAAVEKEERGRRWELTREKKAAIPRQPMSRWWILAWNVSWYLGCCLLAISPRALLKFTSLSWISLNYIFENLCKWDSKTMSNVTFINPCRAKTNLGDYSC